MIDNQAKNSRRILFPAHALPRGRGAYLAQGERRWGIHIASRLMDYLGLNWEWNNLSEMNELFKVMVFGKSMCNAL